MFEPAQDAEPDLRLTCTHCHRPMYLVGGSDIPPDEELICAMCSRERRAEEKARQHALRDDRDGL